MKRIHSWYNPHAIKGDLFCVPFHPISEIVAKKEDFYGVQFRVYSPFSERVNHYILPYPEKGVSVVTLQNPNPDTWDEDGVSPTVEFEIPALTKNPLNKNEILEYIRKFIPSFYSSWVVVGVSYPDPDFEDEF